MPGRGPAPKAPGQRRSRHTPRRGEWQAVPGVGWKGTPIPKPPVGLLPSSRRAWAVWFGAWFAAHWDPGDVPGLWITIRLFDEVERGRFQRVGELRLWAASYGITPAGQQERRWTRPEEPAEPAQPGEPRRGQYGHLHAVDRGAS